MKLFDIKGPAPSQELDETLRAVVMNNFRAAAPVLEYAEFYTHTGNADSVYPKSATKAGKFRNLNENVTRETSEVGTPVSVDFKILSDTISTDRALIDRGVVVADEHLRSLTEASIAMGRYFTDMLVNGTGAAKDITGLKAKITGASDVIFDTANGGYVPFGDTDANKAQQMKFLELLNKLIYEMNPTAILMNASLIARLETVAAGFLRVSNIKDAVSQNQRILDYKGVPIVNTGYAKDETTQVIGNAETVGTSNNCTSLYLVKFGERKDTTFNTTKTGLKVIHDAKDKNFVSTDIELQYNLAVLEEKSAKRIKGIRL